MPRAAPVTSATLPCNGATCHAEPPECRSDDAAEAATAPAPALAGPARAVSRRAWARAGRGRDGGRLLTAAPPAARGAGLLRAVADAGALRARRHRRCASRHPVLLDAVPDVGRPQHVELRRSRERRRVGALARARRRRPSRAPRLPAARSSVTGTMTWLYVGRQRDVAHGRLAARLRSARSSGLPGKLSAIRSTSMKKPVNSSTVSGILRSVSRLSHYSGSTRAKPPAPTADPYATGQPDDRPLLPVNGSMIVVRVFVASPVSGFHTCSVSPPRPPGPSGS